MTDIMRRLAAANPVRRGERPDIQAVWNKLDQANPMDRHRIAGPPSRWRHAPAVGVLAAGCVVSIVIAVAALTLLSHGHTAGPASPVPPAVSTRAELQYVQKANERALATPACRAPRPPLTNNGSPSRSFVSILGVLRRAARSGDTLPRSLRYGRGVRGIDLAYVRLALTRKGTSYYVVPVQSLAPSRAPTTRCDQAQTAALHAGLSHIPPRLRAATLALQIRQRRTLARILGPGVCLMAENASDINTVCAPSAVEISQQGMITSVGTLSGIVPDGVASVTVRSHATKHVRAVSITTPVVGNVFATSIQTQTHGNTQPTLIWRSAQGATLKTLPGATRFHNYGDSSGYAGR